LGGGTVGRVCGFLVLRRPDFAYEATGGLIGYSRPRCVGDLYCGGVDRLAWFDLNEAHARGILPPEIQALRTEIYERNTNWNVLLSQDYAKASRLLAHSNASAARNELCAVSSNKLAATKGVVDSPPRVEWLGLDLFVGGYGSMRTSRQSRSGSDDRCDRI